MSWFLLSALSITLYLDHVMFFLKHFSSFRQTASLNMFGKNAINMLTSCWAFLFCFFKTSLKEKWQTQIILNSTIKRQRQTQPKNTYIHINIYIKIDNNMTTTEMKAFSFFKITVFKKYFSFSYRAKKTKNNNWTMYTTFLSLK